MPYQNDEQQLDSDVSKDMKGVGIPDARVMAEDRMHWKRVVAEHATPQEGMLPD